MKTTVVLAGVIAALCAVEGCAHRSTRPPVNPYAPSTPRVVQQVAPAYPDGFCRRGPGRAAVRVLALVGTNGTVEDVRVSRSDPALARAAAACVRRWKFAPGRTEFGHPLRVWTPVEVRWDCSKRR